MLGGGALSLGLSMHRDPTTVSAARLPPSKREAHGLCAPASQRVCLSRGAGAPERTWTMLLTRRRAICMPHGHLSEALGEPTVCQVAILLLSELLRTPFSRSSRRREVARGAGPERAGAMQ